MGSVPQQPRGSIPSPDRVPGPADPGRGLPGAGSAAYDRRRAPAAPSDRQARESGETAMTDRDPAASGQRATAPEPRRQYVKFTFYKLLPAWRRLPDLDRDRQRAEFQAVVEAWAGRTMVRCYSTVGTRGDT